MNINASITADVDSSQQKRIADLEENVLHLSVIIGKHELERKQDKEQIAALENECDGLRKRLEKDAQLPQVVRHQETPTEHKPRNVCNKACQTEAVRDEVKQNEQINSAHKYTQTTTEEETKQLSDSKAQSNKAKQQDTAVVAPLPRHSPSVSEIDISDDDEDNDGPVEFHRVGTVPDETTISDAASAVGSSGVSLFYVNELARKELELAESRLRVREYECSIREMQWKYNNEKYRLQSRIADLELLNNNFMVSKNDRTTLSTVNVAYIKNVLTKLLDTKDKEKKQIMINALLTALNSIPQ